MIDSDYHRRASCMAVANAHVASELLEPEPPARNSAADMALTALLDHLAEELAREYVCLREKAAREEPIDEDVSR
jgi:hypothetical protein